VIEPIVTAYIIGMIITFFAGLMSGRGDILLLAPVWPLLYLKTVFRLLF